MPNIYTWKYISLVHVKFKSDYIIYNLYSTSIIKLKKYKI